MIIIPTINPIRFSLSGINEPEVENAFYADYYQKYQRSDTTAIQILIPEDEPVQDWSLIAVATETGAAVYTAPQETFDDKIEGHLVVEFGIDFSQFPEGKYRFILQSGTGFKYRSDIICVREKHEHTRLLSYANSYNDHGVAFNTGIVFHLRVETQLYKSVIPKSEDSTYTDNLGGYRLLTSSPYSNDRLHIGGTTGIPDWLIKIINQAFSCDKLYLNSVEIVKVDGATFEAVEQDNYNLRGWNIEIGHIENSLFYEEHLVTVNGEQEYRLNTSFEAHTDMVTVVATSVWSVYSDLPDWITVIPVHGSAYDSHELQLVFLKNKRKTPRSGTVILHLDAHPLIQAKIIVEQEAIQASGTWDDFINIWDDAHFITLSEGVINAAAGGSVQNITVTAAGGGWTVASKPDWLTVTPATGAAGETAVTVTAGANADTSARNGEVVFRHTEDESKTATLSVEQAAAVPEPEPELSLALSHYSYIAAAAAGDDMVMVTAVGGGWLVTSKPDWVTLSLYEGGSGQVVTVAVSQNTGVVRQGSVVFAHSADSSITATLAVWQETGLAPKYVDIYSKKMDGTAPGTDTYLVYLQTGGALGVDVTVDFTLQEKSGEPYNFVLTLYAGTTQSSTGSCPASVADVDYTVTLNEYSPTVDSDGAYIEITGNDN